MTERFETLLFDFFNRIERKMRLTPLNLGGIISVSGGGGSPPGGFVGQLPQGRVTYDITEAEISGFVASSPYSESGILISASLLDNLNHIRWRISQLEEGMLDAYEKGNLVDIGITVVDFLTDKIEETTENRITVSSYYTTFESLIDTPNDYSGQANKYVSVKSSEDGLEFLTISGAADNFKVKVSSDDTTESFLEDKITITGGENVSITPTTTNPGGNEVRNFEISISSFSWSGIYNKPYRVLTFGYQGELSQKTLEAKLYAPFAGTIVNVVVSVNTAPTGSSLVIDVNKNGTTIFTTQGNRPTIPATNTSDLSSIPDVTSFSMDDLFSVDIDQVGATIPGSDLVVQVRCEV